MQCTSCGTEIADKAIVCYRCGAPTAIPAPARRTEATPVRSRRPLWPLLVVLLAIVALAVWLVPKTPAEGGARYAAYAGVALITFLAVRLLRPR